MNNYVAKHAGKFNTSKIIPSGKEYDRTKKYEEVNNHIFFMSDEEKEEDKMLEEELLYYYMRN